ncbi:RDD family protein [Pleurocapsa sp. FMAR1]|uniref:RDD family protein n=1 Tax=Pleurocapsa sp. FMAR1 TaxID=3040204 RepID=UPI0029C6F098|nr:RDD family protein [Pleurocapsa sp. FMAR1]
MRFFNQINLQTPESVELEFTLAGIGNRAFALIIDYIIISLTALLTWGVSYFFAYQIDPGFIFGSNPDLLAQWIIAIQSLVAFAIYAGYFVILETLWQGQTPGKKWTKIRVIRDNGKPERLPQAILRALLRPVDDILFIGVFFIFFSQKEKRIGDLVAGTLVVQDEQASKSANFDISPEAQDLAVQLKIESEITNLLPEDFATIRDFLQRRQNIMLEYQHQLSRKLAEQVKEIILLEKVPENYSNSQFLEAIYLAYQQNNDY